MKTNTKILGCLIPRNKMLHCVLFALIFSHFIASPTARAVMNEYLDYALISKIGIELKKKKVRLLMAPAGSLVFFRMNGCFHRSVLTTAVTHLGVHLLCQR